MFPQVRDAFDEIDVIERRDGQISFVEVERWLRQADPSNDVRASARRGRFHEAVFCHRVHAHLLPVAILTPDLPLITQAEQLLPSSIRAPRNPPHLSPCQAPR